MRSSLFLTLRVWLPLAFVLTAIALMVYLAVQQNFRSNANDPQIQMAEDGASAVRSGKTPESILPLPVDIGRSLAPFVTVFDEQGKPVASSGSLDGKLVAPPSGVFDFARAHGEQRVTWMPRSDVRIASVLVHAGIGNAAYVLAGRSLREIETRTWFLTKIVGLVWMVSVAGLFLLVLLLNKILPAPHARPYGGTDG